MFKTKILSEEYQNVKKMRDMLPGEIGVILDNPGYNQKDGNIVLRTNSFCNFEVTRIDAPREGHCWGKDSELLVKILPPGTQLLIEIT